MREKRRERKRRTWACVRSEGLGNGGSSVLSEPGALSDFETAARNPVCSYMTAISLAILRVSSGRNDVAAENKKKKGPFWCVSRAVRWLRVPQSPRQQLLIVKVGF
jgi:hypothetical protein